MTRFIKCFCLLALCGVCGCSSIRPVDPLNQQGPLTQSQKKNQQRLMREENQKISKIIGNPRSEKGRSNPAISVANRPAIQFSLPERLTESSVYAEVLRSYQIRDVAQMEFYTDEFIQRYPDSVFADNALYLNAQLKLETGLVSQSLRGFDRVLSQYPKGNKKSAALLGKAIAFRKLRLFKYAGDMLQALREEYPGSAEYYKVELEQKLLGLEQGQM